MSYQFSTFTLQRLKQQHPSQFTQLQLQCNYNAATTMQIRFYSSNLT